MATQGQNTSQVGSINVGVTADLTGLRSGLKQAEAEAKVAAPKIAAAAAVPVGDKSAAFAAGSRGAAAAGAGGFTAAGQSLKGLTQPVRTLLQGLQSVVSIFLRLSGLIGILVSGFLVLRGVFDRMSGASRDVADNLRRLDENLSKIISERGQRGAKDVFAAFGSITNPERLAEASDRVADLRAELSKLAASGPTNFGATLIGGQVVPNFPALEEAEKRVAFLRDVAEHPEKYGHTPQYRAQLIDELRVLEAMIPKLRELARLQNEIAGSTERTQRARQAILQLERSAARLKAQERAMADRQAADISRIAQLMEIVVRQRRGL